MYCRWRRRPCPLRRSSQARRRSPRRLAIASWPWLTAAPPAATRSSPRRRRTKPPAALCGWARRSGEAERWLASHHPTDNQQARQGHPEEDQTRRAVEETERGILAKLRSYKQHQCHARAVGEYNERHGRQYDRGAAGQRAPGSEGPQRRQREQRDERAHTRARIGDDEGEPLGGEDQTISLNGYAHALR